MQQYRHPHSPAPANRREGAFNGSKWNLYLEWRLLHCHDLTKRSSALLDAIARMLLGYRKSRGEIGRRLLMEMADIADSRDFNKVRNELSALGLGVGHAGRGPNTRTTYDLGPLLAEALEASKDRRFHGRRSKKESTVPQPFISTVVQPSISTAPEPPRIETSSSSREAVGLPSNDSFGVDPSRHESAIVAHPPETGSLSHAPTFITLERTLAPLVARVEDPNVAPRWERDVPDAHTRPKLPWDES